MNYNSITSVIIATILFMLSRFVHASPAEQLTALLAPLNSLDGDFEQTLTDETGEVLQVSSGIFSLQRPGFFRWQTLAPFPQLVVSNQQRIWLYDEELEQVIVRPYTETMDKTPALLLSGNPNQLSAHYHISHHLAGDLENSANSVVREIKKSTAQIDSDDAFVLVHKGDNASFNKIILFFKNRQLSAMQLTDTFGQVSLIDFTHLKVNPLLAMSLFTFKPPPGVDIITDD